MSPELMKRLADFVAENQKILDQRQGAIADLCKTIKLRFGVQNPDAENVDSVTTSIAVNGSAEPLVDFEDSINESSKVADKSFLSDTGSCSLHEPAVSDIPENCSASIDVIQGSTDEPNNYFIGDISKASVLDTDISIQCSSDEPDISFIADIKEASLHSVPDTDIFIQDSANIIVNESIRYYNDLSDLSDLSDFSDFSSFPVFLEPLTVLQSTTGDFEDFIDCNDL